jgi:malate dehydrogenase (oxaloacetate-decarboxylating)(NADP+)
MICTGRSDYPNQVNNVLCFPYIFRGALDVGASSINEAMKEAAVKAIAGLAREEPDESTSRAYGDFNHVFGPNYLIPTPFDQRLLLRVAPAVAQAAMDSGVAQRPIEDFAAYQDRLSRFVFKSGLLMKPIVEQAKHTPQRIVYCDGEDERVLRAAQVMIEEGMGIPILVGRPAVIAQRCERYGLKIRPGTDFEYIDPQDDPRYRDYVDLLFSRMGRSGVSPETARGLVRTNTTIIGCLSILRDEADAMICGLDGPFASHLRDIRAVIGKSPKVRDLSTLSLIINQSGAYFLTDTHVTVDPSADEIAEMTLLATAHMRRCGIEPRVALLSHSNFGSRKTQSAKKMREALALIKKLAPDLEVDGEMHADAALSSALRARVMPESPLTETANLLVFPGLDAANITLNTVKVLTDGLHVGPIMLGADKPCHIITQSATSRGVVNMSALAAVDAISRRSDDE